MKLYQENSKFFILSITRIGTERYDIGFFFLRNVGQIA